MTRNSTYRRSPSAKPVVEILDHSVIYRIRVLLDNREIGHIDADTVISGRELRNVNTEKYFALKGDRTLPIEFRIEQGIEPASVAYVLRRDRNDANPGTREEPLKNVQAGIDRVLSEFSEGEVHVAAGTYPVYYELEVYITLAEGVSIYGGYLSEQQTYTLHQESCQTPYLAEPD